MKRFTYKNLCLLGVCLIAATAKGHAQSGNVSINQSPSIATLLELKKEINKSEEDAERYKIQIYSGSRSKAESSRTAFRHAYNQWPAKLEYETPNYKVWIGNFRTKLEADRALVEIKKKFPSAFPFKPKKEK